MKKHIIGAAIVIAAIVWSAGLVAQPAPMFSKQAPLTGTGSNGSPLRIAACGDGSGYLYGSGAWNCASVIQQIIGGDGMAGVVGGSTVTINMRQDCSNDDVLKWTGGDWDCATDESGGGIAEIIAGTNLDGGGSASTVTVDLAPTILMTGSASASTIELQDTATGQTDPQDQLAINRTGSVSTAGGNVSMAAISIVDTTTESGGANTLLKRGIHISVQNGDDARGLEVAAGRSIFSDHVTLGDDAVIGDDSGDVITFTGGTNAFRQAVGTSIAASTANVLLGDTTDMAQGVGGAAVFTGESIASDATQYQAAIIKAMKTNGTTGNRCYDLVFGTRRGGGSGDPLTEVMRLLCTGVLDATYGVTTAANIETTGTGDLVSADDLTVADDATISGDLTVSGVTAVGQLIGTSQDVSTTGTIDDLTLNANATVLRFTGASGVTLNGIARSGGNVDNDCIEVVISTTSNAALAVAHEAGTSTTANRSVTSTGTTFSWMSGARTRACYDGGDARWRWESNTRFPAITATGTVTLSSTAALNGNTTLGDASGDLINVAGILKDTGTAPTLSSCGTSPTVVGGSWSFAITVGSGTTTACTATFASTKTNIASCTASVRNSTEEVYLSSVAGSAITLTAKSGTTDLAGDVIDVICVGR